MLQNASVVHQHPVAPCCKRWFWRGVFSSSCCVGSTFGADVFTGILTWGGFLFSFFFFPNCKQTEDDIFLRKWMRFYLLMGIYFLIFWSFLSSIPVTLRKVHRPFSWSSKTLCYWPPVVSALNKQVCEHVNKEKSDCFYSPIKLSWDPKRRKQE